MVMACDASLSTCMRLAAENLWFGEGYHSFSPRRSYASTKLSASLEVLALSRLG